ncbi:MAG: STAS domain-containing protein [Firmicutes bacterium]|nr:STAS domain-containing protein [Bacillota bacterium]
MKVYHSENTVFIELEGDISFNNAQEIRQIISDNIRDTDNAAVVNLSKVEFMDSSGLSIFITLLKRLKQQEGRLILEYPQLGVQRFLEMTRLDQLMEIRKCEEPTTGSWPVAKK